MLYDTVMPNTKAWMETHREQERARSRAQLRRLRAEFLAAYGSTCHCCGEAHPDFLTVGHTLGDGAAHRRELLGDRSPGGTRMYLALKRAGWPKDRGIQAECFNCNMGAARTNGTCPHAAGSTMGQPEVLNKGGSQPAKSVID